MTPEQLAKKRANGMFCSVFFSLFDSYVHSYCFQPPLHKPKTPIHIPSISQPLLITIQSHNVQKNEIDSLLQIVRHSGPSVNATKAKLRISNAKFATSNLGSRIRRCRRLSAKRQL